MSTKKYDELFAIFTNYEEIDWYNLISDVLENRPLELPIIIDNGLPEETLFFIDSFLRKREKVKADYFSKQLVDYYTTLSPFLHNYKKFESLNWVFSEIKPIKYRYALENKFTAEDFLNDFPGETGEILQLSLLSVLSSLRLVKSESISDYLFNRESAFLSDDFVLVSLRYFRKTGDDELFKKYLNQLIENRLNVKNVNLFVEGLRELVFQKKSYKTIYFWVTELDFKSCEKMLTLKEGLQSWINYENKHMQKEEYNYCDLVFFELNKNTLIPCFTLERIIRRSHLYEFQLNDIRNYLSMDCMIVEGLLEHSYQKFPPYRIVSRFNHIILDKDRCSTDTLNKLSMKYKLPVEKILFAELTKDESEKLKFLQNSQIPLKVA